MPVSSSFASLFSQTTTGSMTQNFEPIRRLAASKVHSFIANTLVVCLTLEPLPLVYDRDACTNKTKVRFACLNKVAILKFLLI